MDERISKVVQRLRKALGSFERLLDCQDGRVRLTAKIAIVKSGTWGLGHEGRQELVELLLVRKVAGRTRKPVRALQLRPNIRSTSIQSSKTTGWGLDGGIKTPFGQRKYVPSPPPSRPPEPL